MNRNTKIATISMAEFKDQWSWAYYNWHGKFLAKYKEGKKPQDVSSETQTFFIWNGKHGTYREHELIPRKTLVYGTKDKPQFITPKEFLELFEYTDENPLGDQGEAANKKYLSALQKMKEEIGKNV